MTNKPIPSAPSLEYYRKQAKTLHKYVCANDPESIVRVQSLLPRFNLGDRFQLSDAQWIVAREHGFASWVKFRCQVEALANSHQKPDDGRLAIDNAGTNNEPDPANPIVQRPSSIVESKEKTMTATQAAPRGGTIGTDAVKAKTGMGWDEWFAILDDADCAKMTHKEIVAVCHEHGMGSWWQQMVTVQYEQARGLRVLNQSCDGVFQVNVSKTLNTSIEKAFTAWNDPGMREQWLPNAGMTIRKATSPKSLRITWNDGSNVDVNLFAKGEAKCSCAAEHSKLSGLEEVEERRAFWSAAIERLKLYVES